MTLIPNQNKKTPNPQITLAKKRITGAVTPHRAKEKKRNKGEKGKKNTQARALDSGLGK